MVLDAICRLETLRAKFLLSLAGFGALGILTAAYTVGGNYLAVSGYGNWRMVTQELVGWLCLLAILVMALAACGTLMQKSRAVSLAILCGASCFVLLTLVALWWGEQIRYRGFARLAQQAAPLVAAIEEYERLHGGPPEDLATVQRVMAYDISGGQDSLPDFEYYSGYLAKERYHGNPWILRLEVPTGPLRWDQFIYYPLQNYPSLGHGGWFEPIGDWAYIHD